MSTKTSTIVFLRRQWRFLLFGALVMFWTGPGQTYLISLFGDQWRHQFALSHGDFGLLYTLATLTSAALLWPTGRLVDSLRLSRFVWWICAAMSVAAISVSLVSGPVSLFFAILGVRFLGQGMMSHIAVTAMARRYVTERGRAIAIAGFGFPIGEALFPPLITISLGLTSWQSIWILMGVAAALTLLPFVPTLLQRTAGQDGQGPDSLASKTTDQKQWTRNEMLRDRRFILIVPLIMTLSAIFTGIIFHQKHIITELKHWDFLWWSICFSIFALSQVIGSFSAGWLVDHVTARRITPYVLVPFLLSLLILGLAGQDSWAILIMAAMGISAGATGPVYSSLWAELYGTEHLGSIRAAAAVIMVFASALGPIVIGWALDADISIQAICFTSIVITILTSLSAALGLNRPETN